MIAEPLTPRLMPLDRRVLAVIAEKPERAGAVAALLFGEPHWECERCGLTDWDCGWGGAPRRFLAQSRRYHCGQCWDGNSPLSSGALQHPILIASEEHTREVRQVLRGLERVGLASCRGGWWRAC